MRFATTSPPQAVAARNEAERTRAASRASASDASRALSDIGRGMADLAHGRAYAATLRNIGVWLRHVIAMDGNTPDIVLAGDAVIAACEELATAVSWCAAALEAEVYPPEAEVAGLAFQRFWRAINGAAHPQVTAEPIPASCLTSVSPVLSRDADRLQTGQASSHHPRLRRRPR